MNKPEIKDKPKGLKIMTGLEITRQVTDRLGFWKYQINFNSLKRKKESKQAYLPLEGGGGLLEFIEVLFDKHGWVDPNSGEPFINISKETLEHYIKSQLEGVTEKDIYDTKNTHEKVDRGG